MISLVSTASRVSLKYSPDFSPKDLSASKILETESFIVATSNYYPTQENKRGYIEKINIGRVVPYQNFQSWKPPLRPTSASNSPKRPSFSPQNTGIKRQKKKIA